MALHDTNEPTASAGGGDSFPGAVGVATPPVAVYDEFAGYGDYFGFDQRDRWHFPDGKQWIEFKKLTEGDRAKFLKATRSDVRVNRQSGEAVIPFDQSQDRMQLLLHSITNWHIVKRDHRGAHLVPFPSSQSTTPGGVVAQWINGADPSLLADLEKAIRKANSWMLNEMSVEQIDKEIADLQELREAAVAREAAEKNS